MDYITFQTQYAKRYGVNPAIVLHTLTYFVLKNKKAGRNKYEDKYWTFNSYPGWQESMPFFSKSQIRTSMLVLRKKGAIIVGNFNKKGYDKTFWYTLDPILLQEAESQDYWKKRIGNSKKPSDKFATPIPNNEYIYIEPY